ncbi:hypothetical protein QCD85_12580 [Paenibacillus sp. PsM32]|uniref:hypothetical protein n=1 Tax=unclassified Paenibacillus TaxID=185978 RepID=UPI00236701F0|nr:MULTISPECIES: hypothetical protein [unclassified Paenibacillus]MDN4618941.1 hypothetical protein [Paenibacillus sp. PsM32]WDF52145.1 hypothetical protein PQ460_06950 [Paenibacillus sp. KACC 21273]
MGMNRKSKRKITCLNRVFYWYVKPDWEDAGKVNVHIISEDKKFIVVYEVGQTKIQKTKPFIVIQGLEFAGIAQSRTGYQRVLTPVWKDDIITPSFIEKIIKWSVSPKENLIFVNYLGEIVI